MTVNGRKWWLGMPALIKINDVYYVNKNNECIKSPAGYYHINRNTNTSNIRIR